MRQPGHNKAAGNARIAVLLIGVVAGMGTLAYASVPLYRLFCQVTGFGGTTQQVAGVAGVQVSDRKIIVRFDANSAPGLDWRFRPLQREITVRLGEKVQIAYEAINVSDRPLTGSATFNVTPLAAGAYFNKIECFCFTETTLQPGERLEMPVVFYVDPQIIGEAETRNLKTITLSYTFFEDHTAKPVAGLDDQEAGKDAKQL